MTTWKDIFDRYNIKEESAVNNFEHFLDQIGFDAEDYESEICGLFDILKIKEAEKRPSWFFGRLTTFCLLLQAKAVIDREAMREEREK